MLTPAIVSVIVVALIGWFATIRVISTSKLQEPRKRWLLVASWIPWMVVALGAPIFTGSLPVGEALNIGGAMTAGMMVAVVVSGRQDPRR